MQKRLILIGVLILIALLPVAAGDVATFVNLGFSEDSSVFMFGQYGVIDGEERPYAEIYTVNVHKNAFVKDGVSKKVYDDEAQPGQDGSGGLFNLLHSVAPQVRNYSVDHLKTGRLVYVHVDGNKPKQRIEFRDFYRGNSYVLTLVQQKFGSGKDVSASFHINLAVTSKGGATRTYTLGIPDFRRKGVLSYRIQEVVFSPAESGLVVVVEKELWDEQGKDIRYMVETTSLIQ
jgi:predicted secreted protein